MSVARKHQGAFTLVELLVVIGVISVLIAMLLPSLQKVREQARTVQCMSNQRQMLMGLRMYAGENKQGFPWTHELQTYVFYQWIQALIDHKSVNRQVAKCTSEKRYGFGQYVALWDPTGNTAQGVPHADRNEGWYFYLGRAKGKTRMGSTATVNSPISWGPWSPHNVVGVLTGLNWGQTEDYWRNAVPDSSSKRFFPLTSCPYITAFPFAGSSGAYSLPQGPSWAQLAAHNRERFVNFGNTDGSVISLNVHTPDLTKLYFQTWGKK